MVKLNISAVICFVCTISFMYCMAAAAVYNDMLYFGLGAFLAVLSISLAAIGIRNNNRTKPHTDQATGLIRRFPSETEPDIKLLEIETQEGPAVVGDDIMNSICRDGLIVAVAEGRLYIHSFSSKPTFMEVYELLIDLWKYRRSWRYDDPMPLEMIDRTIFKMNDGYSIHEDSNIKIAECDHGFERLPERTFMFEHELTSELATKKRNQDIRVDMELNTILRHRHSFMLTNGIGPGYLIGGE